MFRHHRILVVFFEDLTVRFVAERRLILWLVLRVLTNASDVLLGLVGDVELSRVGVLIGEA